MAITKSLFICCVFLLSLVFVLGCLPQSKPPVLNTHTITVLAEKNGTIEPEGTISVTEGEFQAFTITPSLGYKILDVFVDGVSVGAVGQYIFQGVQANHTIHVVFEKILTNQHILTIEVNQSGWGITTPAVGACFYDEGTVVTLTATPATGYHFIGWTGNVADSSSPTTTVTMNSNQTVTARFQKIPPLENVLTVTLHDSQNNPIPNGIVEIENTGWQKIGETDKDGKLIIDGYKGPRSVRIRVTAPNHGGMMTSPLQDITENPEFVFQTSLVIIQLKDSTGALADGGNVSFDSSGWLAIGMTGMDGTGVLRHELFPGTYYFRMTFNHGTEEKNHFHTDGGSTLTFQTGLVDIQFSGDINIVVGKGSSYNVPIQMLPVEHQFAFSGPGYSSQEIIFTPTAGQVMEKSVFYIKLLDSQGNGIAEGTARLGVSGWPIMGTTDEKGILLYARDGKVGNMRVRMNIPNGGTQTSPEQNHAQNSFYDFGLVKAVIQLIDSTGSPVEGGEVRFGTSGWPVIGITDTNGELHHELFPGTYDFRMTAPNNGGTETKGQDISTPVIFQTHQVVIELQDHQGHPLSGGEVRIGHGGWPVIGMTDTRGQVIHEYFPGTQNFRMSYNQWTKTQSHTHTAGGSTLTFQE